MDHRCRGRKTRLDGEGRRAVRLLGAPIKPFRTKWRLWSDTHTPSPVSRHKMELNVRYRGGWDAPVWSAL